jgi:hypothetical protein
LSTRWSKVLGCAGWGGMVVRAIGGNFVGGLALVTLLRLLQLPHKVQGPRGQVSRARREVGRRSPSSGFSQQTLDHATAARDAINTSLGIARRSRHVMAIGRSPSWDR